MCGITGFIDHNHSISEGNLKKASATLAHRGGNGSGFIFDQKEHYTLGIANERLATIDLSEKALQPLTSNCGNYSITFNGTIYNYLELRETLIKYGVIFSTLTDTEVILESYKKWGTKSFEKLDGSFAFALIDRKLNQLIIAKDEIGAKPIYYYKNKSCYIFASEISALFAYPVVQKNINATAIATYFRYGYFTGEETIYEHIFKFKKGTITIIDLHSGNSYDSFLSLNYPPIQKPEVENEEQISEKIEELLTEAILKRNVADVPVGVLLGGGYDSATVAAILQKNQTKRIKTFTVGFKNEKLDEAPQASKIAEYLKTNHHEYYLDKEEALTIVKNLPHVFDEPIGDSGAIPLLFIGEKVNKEVKVLLGAEGGDELFGGYRTYAKAIKLDALEHKHIPKFLKEILINFLKTTQPKMKEVLAAEGLLNKYLEINACFTASEINRLLTSDYNFSTKSGNKAQNIKDLLIHDLHDYLPNNILSMSDKCFMQYGIDNRDALLKTDLIAYLTTLDSKWFIKDGEQKYLLKKITNKYIPESLMNKPKKGFVIPLASWLKTAFRPLIEIYLSPESLNQHKLLNIQEVLRIKAAFYANPTTYNAQKIWLLLQFQMWHQKWIA
ncbi:asparagine synthase (glutamine-hydrolyzing) [Pedobacter sp. LMG 31464]|uniref:asparagine synthase (glutamine-hydrolyzing) n=1 Tax=Pedobacter planticolens TaxID=2679964 RepID=A0A923DV35_9SPHI|nr:asparagine synthase (glutamine-hydrolyzing) [Pedobacter planticolens]MBB2144454.1 asparagine synthase (glutamine-hydrolyzing) [Pedobacter planticolens]